MWPKKVAIDFQIPLGVILTISPFNYPVNLAVSKFAPALIAENSIVLKPPTQVCVVLVLVQGVELSIVNQEPHTNGPVLDDVLLADPEIADAIENEKTVDITFTGSVGQSFGCFLTTGMNIHLVGEANDFVGKVFRSIDSNSVKGFPKEPKDAIQRVK
ncbi:Ferredoxin-dependent glutamate synthase, variant 2 [Trifolium repens]|nr:Ferredoxin-dependent glutamate synthase, variant 2 [Trifolium repens]